MKKRYICLLLLLCCIFVFTACRNNNAKTSANTGDTLKQNPENSNENVTPSDRDNSNIGENQNTAVSPDTNENLDMSEKSDQPIFIVRVTAADHPVYPSPNKSAQPSATVEQAGSYTIVEEVKDENNNLWGRLLSGAGWIEVTGLYRRYVPRMVLTADYASAELLKSENVHKFVLNSSIYTQPISIIAHRTLKDFAFCATEFGDNARMNITETLYNLQEITPEKPIVAYISFPGDFTTFALTFTDEFGVKYIYYISQSGKDGSIFLADMTE